MVEFALLGALVVSLMIGVLQIGMAMQAYNALRSASADLARYAAVQRQGGSPVDAAGLATKARSIATAPPYGLNSANLGTASVTPAATRVAGVTEFVITYEYSVPNVLHFAGIGAIPLSYSRPIFVLN